MVEHAAHNGNNKGSSPFGLSLTCRLYACVCVLYMLCISKGKFGYLNRLYMYSLKKYSVFVKIVLECGLRKLI